MFFKRILVAFLCTLSATSVVKSENTHLFRSPGEPLYRLHLRIDSINTFLSSSSEFYFQYPDSSLLLAREVHAFSDSIQYVKGSAHSAENLGKIQFIQGDLKSSLQSFFSAFDRNDLLGREHALGVNLAWISWLNVQAGRPESAEEYFRVATSLLHSSDSVHELDVAFLNMIKGALLLKDERIARADSMLAKAFLAFPKAHILKDEALLLQQQAMIAEGKIKYAADLTSDKDIGYAKGVAGLNLLRAQLMVEDGQSDDALSLLTSTLDLTKRSGLEAERRVTLKRLGRLLGNMGNDGDAYTYIDKYYQLDSGESEKEVQHFFSEMDQQFGNKALEKQVDLLEKRQTILEQEAEINMLKLKNSRLLLFLSFAFVALSGLLAYQYYRRNKLKNIINQELQKHNIQVSQQKDKIQQQHDEILQKNEIIEHQNRTLISTNQQLEEKVLERTRKLKRAYKDLKNFNTELDTFIYKAYHDIRGPLISMKGLCQISLSDVKDEKALEYLQEMNGVTNRMNDLMNSMLRITEIKDKPIERQQIELEGVIDQIVGRYQSNGKKINFEYDFEVRGLHTDEELLHTILENVVKNAVQYSYSNGTPAHIRIITEKKGTSYVMKIEDNGIGIPEEVSTRIFDMFYRGTTASEGFGLGLYTARVAARRLKGDLRYAKTKTGHTQFSVVIPS